MGESHATRFSKAGRSSADLECRWSAGGRFLACDMQIVAGGDSIEQISAYGPADSGRFALYAVTPGGRPAYQWRVTIVGSTWTYENPDAPATGPRWRTVTMGESRRDALARRFSDDGVHWTTTNEGVTTKVG